jgi:hypothetical protein
VFSVAIVKSVVVWVVILYFSERENAEVSEEYTPSAFRVEICRFTTQDSFRAVPRPTLVVLVSNPVWAPDQTLLYSKRSWLLSTADILLRGEDGSAAYIAKA